MNGDMKMRDSLRLQGRERGVMLIEALIAILIFSIGILAVVGMQGMAIKNVTESKYRSEAAFLAEELTAQMWMDQNINALTKVNTSNVTAINYNYTGVGNAPDRLKPWVARVKLMLPGTTVVGVIPKVTITNPTASGATVQIQIFWQLPEEASLSLPPHSLTVVASIQV